MILYRYSNLFSGVRNLDKECKWYNVTFESFSESQILKQLSDGYVCNLILHH
jgi:hypothetical protein